MFGTDRPFHRLHDFVNDRVDSPPRIYRQLPASDAPEVPYSLPKWHEVPNYPLSVKLVVWTLMGA